MVSMMSARVVVKWYFQCAIPENMFAFEGIGFAYQGHASLW